MFSWLEMCLIDLQEKSFSTSINLAMFFNSLDCPNFILINYPLLLLHGERTLDGHHEQLFLKYKRQIMSKYKGGGGEVGVQENVDNT
jgi:hypothetical protein